MTARKLHAISNRCIALAVSCATAFAAADTSVAEDKPVNLQVGDKAPVFEGTTDAGKTWKAADTVGKKYLVVYFYPADFTTGCTRQATVWRDNMNAVAKQGIEVVGVSGDPVRAHKLFKQVWKLNYTLLADGEAKIAKQFGVPIRGGGRVFPRGTDRKPLTDADGKRIVLKRKASFARWTFIIGKDGKIVYKNTRVNPAKDSQQVLEFIEKRTASNSP